MALSAALATAIVGLPAAFGVPWLVGDNLIQNFPLRVLVGTDLRHGHLPLWDPYLWSGAPLLAGFNAGAAYPTTWLFAVLPGTLAWVVNQVAVEVVAAAGVVVLLRVLGRSWPASGLAAGAFAFGGFMTAQSVHLDLVQAAAWLPWAFVALDRLAHRPDGRPAAPWVALLGASLGLMILSGAVEPIFDGGIVLALYAVWLAVRTPGPRRLHVVAGAASGLVVGLALAAAQLLPGAAFQAQSQHGMHSYAFFTSGSMDKSLTLLGIDPLLLGGAHSFPLGFIGSFTLPEVSSYIGILPLMGLTGLLARRHRRAPEAGQWWIWYAIVVVGLFLAWGGFTPVAHLFYDIPFFNRQRLLNRNLLEVDLALAVIFATWVDRTFTGGADRPARRWTSEVVWPLVPVAAVVGLQLTLLVGGPWFPHLLDVPGRVTRATLWPLVGLLTVPSAIALAAGWTVVRRWRTGARWPGALLALMVIDLGVFNVGIQATPEAGNAASAPSASARRLVSLVEAQGQGPAGGLHRMAVFDPDRFYGPETDRLGQPDLTILRSLHSVQGYGAVVDERYDAETGTHLQLNLTPTVLSGSTLAQLDLGLLVTVPQYFVHLVTAPPGFRRSIANGAVPLPPVAPHPSAAVDTSAPAPTPPGDYTDTVAPPPTATLTPGVARTQFFGTALSATAVTVPLPLGADGSLRVGLLPPDGGGTTAWLGPPALLAGRHQITVRAARGRPAGGVVLLVGGAPALSGPNPHGAGPPVTVGDVVVRTAGQGTYRVDGSLRDVMTPPRWRFVGRDGVFGVFAQRGARGRAWVDGAPAATARVLSDAPWGTETIRVVSDRAATLVRSVAFASGWQATVTGVGAGPHPATSSRPVVVQRHGLVQSVRVAAGVHVVRFAYRPSRAYEGLGVSAAGAAAVALLAAGPTVVRHRRRRRVAPGPGP